MDSTTSSRMVQWIKLLIDFNKNHKIRALREENGDWMPLVWIEILIDSQSRNGFLPGTLEDLAAEYSKLWMSPRVDRRSKRRQRGGKRATDKCLKGLKQMVDLGMIRVENEGIKICNSARYMKKPPKKEEKRGVKSREDRGKTAELVLEIASYREQLKTIIDLYPAEKVGKLDLLQKIWNANSLWRDTGAIIASIVAWKGSAEWQGNEGKYIPQLVNFIDHKKYRESPHKASRSEGQGGESLVATHQRIMEERHAG